MAKIDELESDLRHYEQELGWVEERAVVLRDAIAKVQAKIDAEQKKMTTPDSVEKTE